MSDCTGGQNYYLCIAFDAENGVPPGINVCGKEYELRENQNLLLNDEELETQLVVMYRYSDVLMGKNIAFVCALCFLIVLGIIGKPIKRRGINRALGIGAFLLAPPLLGYYLEMTSTDMTWLTVRNLWINIGLIYFVWLVLLLLTLSWKASVAAGTILVSVCYIANHYYIRFRGNPFKFREIYAWRTAAKVIGNYDFTPDKRLSVKAGAGSDGVT